MGCKMNIHHTLPLTKKQTFFIIKAIYSTLLYKCQSILKLNLLQTPALALMVAKSDRCSAW
jgi:hypothetical protein